MAFLGDGKAQRCGSQDLRLIENLRVRLVEARDLPIRGASSSSDRRVFCLVKLDREEIYHSVAVPKRINPFFHDEFSKEVPRTFRQLHFYLYDSGRVPRPFARLSFKKSEVLKWSGQDAWFPLKPCDRHAEVCGKMHLSIDYEECLTGSGTVSQSIRLRVLGYSDLNVPCSSAGANKNVDLYLIVTPQAAGYLMEPRKLRIPYRKQPLSAKSSPSEESNKGGISLSTSFDAGSAWPPSTSASAPALDRRRTSPSPTFDEPPTLKIDLNTLAKCTRVQDSDSPPASPTDVAYSMVLGGENDSSCSSDSPSHQPPSPPHLDATTTNTTQLKVSLWHDVAGKNQAYFHGEVRIPLDPKTLKPKNGAVHPHVAWYYLKPRTHSTSSQSQMATSSPTSSTAGPTAELGALRLQLVYTVDHILPLGQYAELYDNVLSSVPQTTPTAFQFTPAGITELLPRVDLAAVARPLMKIFLHENRIRSLIRTLAAQEISRCEDVNTLFRSSSLASKVVYELMKFVGQQYLLTTLKPCIDKIYAEKKCCEVDPCKLSPSQSLEENTRNLVGYTEAVFARVTDSNHRCPPILKEIFADLRDITVLHFPDRIEVQRLVLGSFLVMRFFSAAIVNPKLFNLKRENAEPTVSRTLTLISKILQKLSNYVVCGHGMTSKERWLQPILDQFLNETHLLGVVRFLDRISCQTGESSASGDSVSVLKEGFLYQRFPKQRRCLELSWMQTKKRFVALTETELIWFKRKGDSNPVSRLSLSELRVAQGADEARFSSLLGGGGGTLPTIGNGNNGAPGQKHVMEFVGGGSQTSPATDSNDGDIQSGGQTIFLQVGKRIIPFGAKMDEASSSSNGADGESATSGGQLYLFEPSQQQLDRVVESRPVTQFNPSRNTLLKREIGADRLQNSDFCSCGHCQTFGVADEWRWELVNPRDCFCCRESGTVNNSNAKKLFAKCGDQCVTTHPEFAKLCLDKDVNLDAPCSQRLEREGLIRALKLLHDDGIVVETIVTDKHAAIRKYMKESHPEIRHELDFWHIKKNNLVKPLVALSKRKNCESSSMLMRGRLTCIDHNKSVGRACVYADDGEPRLTGAYSKSAGKHLSHAVKEPKDTNWRVNIVDDVIERTRELYASGGSLKEKHADVTSPAAKSSRPGPSRDERLQSHLSREKRKLPNRNK